MKLRWVLLSVVFLLVGVSQLRGAQGVTDPATAAEAELRNHTQALLDAIAPGNVAVWDKLLAPNAIQVDENDIVRTKPEILKELTPLPKGLTGNLQIDEFRPVIEGNVAVVTHEDKEYLDYHGQVIRSRFRMTDTWIKTAAGWRLLGSQVLAVQQDPPAVKISHEQLCRFIGKYSLTPEITANIQCDGDKLIVQRAGTPDRTFLPETDTVFFEPGHPRTRRIFQFSSDGKVSGFVDRREERDISWKKLE